MDEVIGRFSVLRRKGKAREREREGLADLLVLQRGGRRRLSGSRFDFITRNCGLAGILNAMDV